MVQELGLMHNNDSLDETGPVHPEPAYLAKLLWLKRWRAEVLGKKEQGGNDEDRASKHDFDAAGITKDMP